MATRKSAYAKVELWDPGQGDPVISDFGAAWTDNISETFQSGTVEYANGHPRLQYINDLGLTHRAFLNPKDTRKVNYTTSSTWDEVLPIGGRYRAYRLRQYSANADVLFSFTSIFSLPTNPQFAVSFIIPDTPEGWDLINKEPYVKFTFGQNYHLFIRRSNIFLFRGEVLLGEIPNPWTENFDEFFFYIRCADGKLFISTDFGRTYSVFTINENIPASQIALLGQGGMMSFGLHELRLFDSWYANAPRYTGFSRVADLIITGIYHGNVVFSDISPDTTHARYQVLLQKSTDTQTQPIITERPTIVYFVTFRYPVVKVLTGAAPTEQWAGKVLSVEINHPLEFDGSSCNFSIYKRISEDWSGNYRWRKVRVLTGYKLSDDTLEEFTSFVGYISDITIQKTDFGYETVNFTVENPSIRFKRTEWTPLHMVSLGGITVNNAADFILGTEGLDVGYRTWDIWGDLKVLPVGKLTQPFEVTKPREKKWETLKRIFGYFGLDLMTTNDGKFKTISRNQISQTVDKKVYIKYEPTQNALDHIGEISSSTHYGEFATSVLTYGESDKGQFIYAWSTDAGAELDLNNPRFSPWRELIQEEISGFSDPNVIIAKNNALSYAHIIPKTDIEFSFTVDVALERTQRIAVYGGTSIGIADGEHHQVLSVSHSFQNREALTELISVVNTRKIIE